MPTRTEVKEIATGRADSAIAEAARAEDVPEQPVDGDWEFLADALGVEREQLDQLEVEDDDHPREVTAVFERNYHRRLRQVFGGEFGP